MSRTPNNSAAGGFRLMEQRHLPGIRSLATRMRHEPSGADLLLVRSPGDREKLFAAVFRTPPADSTGVPHILEHCVLCGSRRFPLKDPFMELVKTSMATYINAVTYDDRTIYPCASLIGRDFFNLVDVYMDAVFHPLLSRHSFLQEGHRLDFLEDGRTARTGVVYSEMRGAYSDPDDYLERKLRTLMFPGTTYGNCSGGEPDRIPDLSYEAFLEFHRDHYHPSNSCLMVMADIPPDEITGFLGERLQGFAPRESRYPISTEPEFTGPVSGEYPVPGSRRAGCTVIRAWLMDRGEDPVESLAISLLDDVLLEGDGAPVKEALISSGLGMGLGPSGYDCDIKRPTFTVGLRGVERPDAGRVFEILGDSLSVCAAGLNPEDTHGLLHRKELYLRRIGQRWAHGILGSAAKAWAHGRNPLDELDEELHLEGLKTRLSKHPGYLEELVSRYFLDNRQMVDAVFYPDPSHFGRMGRKRVRSAALEGERLSPEKREELERQSKLLKLHQESTDPPEVLASMPVLGLCDIPDEPAAFDWVHEQRSTGVHLITVPGFTNGVCHLNLCLGTGHVPDRSLPLVQLAAEMVTGTGAGGLSYQDASREEMACSGGVSPGVAVFEPMSAPGSAHPVVSFNVSCLQTDLPRLLSLLRKRLLSPELDDHTRVMELGREVKSGLQARFTENAGSFAGIRAMACFRGSARVAHRLKGLAMARESCRAVSGKPAVLSGKISGIWNAISGSAPVALSWTGPAASKALLEEFLDGLGGNRIDFAPVSLPGRSPSALTGIVTDSDVACTAGAFPGREPGDPLYEPLAILMTLLGNGPLWNHVRGRLGAYGVTAWSSPGILAFSTYRDPAPAKSLEVIRSTLLDPLNSFVCTEKALRGAVFSTLQRIDPLVRPARAPLSAMAMFLTGTDDGYRRNVWHRLLATDRTSIGKAADAVMSGAERASVCIASNRRTLSELGVTDIEGI